MEFMSLLISKYSVILLDLYLFFFCFLRGEDDFIFINACLKDQKSLFLTEDMLRDHKFYLRGIGTVFKRWIESKRIIPFNLQPENKEAARTFKLIVCLN
jgi:hypothetical protein